MILFVGQILFRDVHLVCFILEAGIGAQRRVSDNMLKKPGVSSVTTLN